MILCQEVLESGPITVLPHEALYGVYTQGEPDNNKDQARKIELDSIVTGYLNPSPTIPGDEDWYYFEADAGTAVSFSLEGTIAGSQKFGYVILNLEFTTTGKGKPEYLKAEGINNKNRKQILKESGRHYLKLTSGSGVQYKFRVNRE